MKKFLFTLATIVTFGLAANAETIDFTMVGPSTYDAAKQEISIDPNGTQTARRQTFHFKAGGMDMPVIGWQIAYRATDENGNILGPDAPVHIRAVGGLYFRKETSGPSTLPENSYANNYDNAEGKQYYIALGANLTYGVVWEMEDWLDIDFGGYDAFIEELGGSDAMLTYPANVIQFQIEVDEGWDGEYVLFDFLDESHKITFYNTSSIKPAHPEFDIKVLNPNYSSTKTIDGTVELGDLNEGFDVPVTINMVDPTEGYVVAVTVNGVEAAIEDGVIVLPNEAGEYTVAVVITADGYEGTVEKSRTYTIEMSAAPDVVVEETDTYVTITAKPATSLVVEGYETMTDEDGSLYVVIPKEEVAEAQTYAYTATNTEAGKLPNTVTGTATVDPLAKAPSSAPEFSITGMDDDYVYITATGTGTVTMLDGHEGNAIDNPVKVARPAYGEPNGSYTAYATNLDEGWYVPTEGNRTFEIPAKAAKVYEIAVPTVTVTPGDDAYTISAAVEGQGNVTLYVTTYDAETGVPTKTAYTNPAEVVIPRTDADQEISYYATAELTEAPEGYDTWTNNASEAVQTVIPAKPVVEPETLEGVIEFGPVNQENGQFTVTYTGSETDVTITLDDETILPVRATTNTFKLPDYGTYTVTATASKAGYKDVTGEATLVWNAPVQPKEFQGTVNVTVDQLGNVTATYVPAEGEEDVVTTVTVNPNHLDSYGEDIEVEVTVTADGYEPKVFTETVDYLQQTAAPSTSKAPYVFKQNGIFYNSFTVTLNGTDPDADADIYYRIGVLGEDGQYTYGDWQLYTGPFNVKQTGEIMVEAYAVADGKTPSELTYDGFTVSVATSIDELFADKAVAGVRYFNMAGQEMQEANGICIAVYNFTDGTQVAVKVMK